MTDNATGANAPKPPTPKPKPKRRPGAVGGIVTIPFDTHDPNR